MLLAKLRSQVAYFDWVEGCTQARMHDVGEEVPMAYTA